MACVHTPTNVNHQGCTGCPNRQLCTIPVDIHQHKVIPSVHLIMYNGGIKCVEVGTHHPQPTYCDYVGRGRGVGCTQNTNITFATFTLKTKLTKTLQILGTLLYCCMTSYCWNSWIYCFLVTQHFDVNFNVISHHHSHPKVLLIVVYDIQILIFIVIVKHCYWPRTYLPFLTL